MSEIDDIIAAANAANKPAEPDNGWDKAPDLPKEGEEVVKEEVPETKEDVLAKIGAILAQYGNMESNIPLNHEYWGLTNKYRNM